MTAETLDEQVKRAKARWLKRVMYQSKATPFQKSLAYAIADHLNCVTLDCWPAQLTLCRKLGGVCMKTLQRAGRGLVAHGVITISRGATGIRYAPVFQPGDEDKPVQKVGQISTDSEDTDVRESFLDIHLTPDSTEAVLAQIQKYGAMIKSPQGFPIQSPYLSIANRQAEIMMRIASEFGFTPASRSRIATPSQPPPSLFDVLDAPGTLGAVVNSEPDSPGPAG